MTLLILYFASKGFLPFTTTFVAGQCYSMDEDRGRPSTIIIDKISENGYCYRQWIRGKWAGALCGKPESIEITYPVSVACPKESNVLGNRR